LPSLSAVTYWLCSAELSSAIQSETSAAAFAVPEDEIFPLMCAGVLALVGPPSVAGACYGTW